MIKTSPPPRKILRQHGQNAPDIKPHGRRQLQCALEHMAAGLDLSEQASSPTDDILGTVCWQKQGVQLRCIPHPHLKQISPVLLVPSPLNSAAIFGLPVHNAHGISLVEHLTQQPRSLYTLTWYPRYGPEGSEPTPNSIPQASELLLSALRWIQNRHSDSVHTVGYCLGGTLTLLAAQQNANAHKSITLLSAPWDFHAEFTEHFDPSIKFWRQILMTSPSPIVDRALVALAFQTLNPTSALLRYRKIATMVDHPKRLHRALAIHRWACEGTSMTRSFALNVIDHCFYANSTMISTPNPSLQQLPSLMVVACRDQLVPLRCALPANQFLPNARVLTLNTGHLGALVSSTHNTQFRMALDRLLATP